VRSIGPVEVVSIYKVTCRKRDEKKGTYSKMTQSTARTHNDDEAAALGIGLAQRCVHGHARTEQRSGGCRVEAVWDGGDVVCGTEDVLLEGARGIVARDFLFS
jgi:hypothetical protein